MHTMTTSRIVRSLMTVWIVLVLSACGTAATPAPTSTPPPTAATVSTSTPVPPTSTIPPTSTSTQTPTATPSATPSATFTATPLPPTATDTALPPTNTPARPTPTQTANAQVVRAVCPAWYAAPEAGKGVLVVDTAPFGVHVFVKEPREIDLGRIEGDTNGVGKKAFQLAPGNYRIFYEDRGVETTFQLTAGQVIAHSFVGDGKVATGPNNSGSFHWKVESNPVAPPPGCPGGPEFVAVPTATITPTAAPCPAWYATPQPSMGLLIIENYDGKRNLDVVATKGQDWTKSVPAKTTDEPGRIIVSLPPGHYEFSASVGGFAVDMQAGQQYLVGLIFPKPPVNLLQRPAGCKP